MLTSNEPGYYETGQYGIRIENLILCVEAAQTTSGRFFRFETLSLCPIDIQLIDASMPPGGKAMAQRLPRRRAARVVAFAQREEIVVGEAVSGCLIEIYWGVPPH